MADVKKYYYLKLKENFYESEEMIILQNMQDGYLYSDILMKLYLRSLKNNGKLMFNNMIPYTPQVLAQVVRHQVGTVEKALQIFKELGLIEILDNGAIYMLDIQNFIGKSSTEADRIRNYRQGIKQEQLGCTNVQQMYDKSTPEIEIEIEIEKEIETEIETEIDNDNDRPITLTELIEIGKNLGVSKEYCKKFYNTYESTNWINKKGEKITDAKNLLEIWVRKDKKNTPEWFDKSIQPNLVSEEEEQKFKEQMEKLRKS